MPEERNTLIVPLLKQLGSDLGGQAGRSRRTPGRRWGKRLRQAVAEPIEIPPEAVPIVEPLLADLGVAYAFDLPHGHELLGPRHCTELGVPPESPARAGDGQPAGTPPRTDPLSGD